jgi:sucrose-phosphate synthase
MADILATCKHGVTVDPDDDDAAASAIRTLIENRAQWQRQSASGREAAAEHYSWRAHVDSYLDNIDKIQAFRGSQVLKSHRPRRFAAARQMLVCDLDGTLTGNAAAISRLNRLIDRRNNILFGIATGRGLDSAQETLRKWKIAEPQFVIASVGTAIHYNVGRYWDDKYWPQHISFRWRPNRVKKLLEDWPGLRPQEDQAQTEFKISYYCERGALIDTRLIKKHFRRNGIQARVVLSESRCLDILPVRASKGHALRYLCWRLGFDAANVITAGDAGNDLDMLRGCTKGIVVANHSRELDELRDHADVYFSARASASGVVDGLTHYGVT